MLTALADNLGNVAKACKQTDISRQSHYRWIKDDPEYTEAVQEQSEVGLDIAEAKLMERIESGDIRAIVFFLKTKGRKRGYGESQSVDIHTSYRPDKIELVTRSELDLESIGYKES
jgi:hypothetical protein